MGNLGVLFQNEYRFEDAIYWFDKAAAASNRSVPLIPTTSPSEIWAGATTAWAIRTKDWRIFSKRRIMRGRSGDPFNEQLWIGNSGTVLYDRDDLRAAAEKFKRALEIAQSLDKDGEGVDRLVVLQPGVRLHRPRRVRRRGKYNQEALRRRQAMADHADFYPRVNEAHIAAGRKDPQAEALYRGLIDEYREGMNPGADARSAGRIGRHCWPTKANSNRPTLISALRWPIWRASAQALARADNRMTYLAKSDPLLRSLHQFPGRPRPDRRRALEVAESSRARVLDERLESKPPHAPVQASRMREMARASHSVFLSYWLGKRRSFLWAVDGGGNRAPSASAGKPDRAAGGRIPGVYRKSPRSAAIGISGRAQSCRRSCWGRFVLCSRPLNQIVLVPDRSLHSLNFETLPDPGDPAKYLIENSTLELAPSLDMLAEARPPVARVGFGSADRRPDAGHRRVSAPSLCRPKSNSSRKSFLPGNRRCSKGAGRIRMHIATRARGIFRGSISRPMRRSIKAVLSIQR